jgi:hypothetical protein
VVYLSTTSGGPYTEVGQVGLINSTTYTLITVPSTNYYVLTAFNSSGHESGYSTELTMIASWNTGLILHWDMEEGAGPNTTEQVSGVTTGAVLNGQLTAWTNGIAPGSSFAVRMDQASPSKSYIHAGSLLDDGVTYVPGLDGLFTLYESWSMSAWIMMDSTNVPHIIAAGWGTGSSAWRFWYDGTLKYTMGTDVITSTISLKPNTTNFVAFLHDSTGYFFGNNSHRFVAWDGSAWQMSDGVETHTPWMRQMFIGNAWPGSIEFTGIIDDVRIYSRTLNYRDLQWLTKDILDSDTDGSPDIEEVFVYGSNPADPDTDGDGMMDGDEIYAGTILTNADSLLAITGGGAVTTNFVMNWIAVSGKTYTLWTSTNLLSTNWWQVGGIITGTPPANSITVTPSTVECEFYRIRVE